MLRKIYINHGFRHNDVTYTFERGMTGIVGKNESGKSLIAEFIRYALFGSKALRGKASEYKKLHVELWFAVGGCEYHVLRKGTKATLSRDGAALASGTKPVDEAILAVLGYGLHVFDVANACTQGNVEALSKMKPAERKAMVDKTIGLDQLDSLITLARQQANGFIREAAAIEGLLNEPVAPEAPTGRTDADAIKAELVEVTHLINEAHSLKGALRNAPAEPAEPAPCAVTETAAELLELVQSVENGKSTLARLKREVAQLTPETVSAELLDEMLAQHDKADRARQKKKLLDQGHHCCPECNHQWPIADVSSFEDVVDLEEPYPPLTRAQIAAEKRNVGNAARIEGLNNTIQTLSTALDAEPDRSADLATRRTYEASVAAYGALREAFDKFTAQKVKFEARLAEIGDQQPKADALDAELQTARQYAFALQEYESKRQRYQLALAELEATKKKAEDYSEAHKRLTALKTSVKTLLLPSLNKVASVLLSRMTGGERNLVTIDEEFEILVDGLPIHTLSGSGAAVTNLAIRSALGQILTNRTFSVFIGDEVDASMDDTRAAYTAEALRRLTDHIQQVILITHKRPETDHMIELTK